MTLQALPLWANVTPASQRRVVVRGLTDALERPEHHLLSGIVGTKFILPVLAQHGKLVRPRAHLNLFATLACLSVRSQWRLLAAGRMLRSGC